MSRRSVSVPTGRRGRAGRLAVSSVYTGFAPGLLLISSTHVEIPGFLLLLAIQSLLLTAWLWLRLPFTGVRTEGEAVVVTAWWSRKVIPRDQLVRFRVETYGGPFYFLAWAIDAGPFESGELEAELKDGTRVRLRGTVCGRRVANDISRSLNEWLGTGLNLRSRNRKKTWPPPRGTPWD